MKFKNQNLLIFNSSNLADPFHVAKFKFCVYFHPVGSFCVNYYIIMLYFNGRVKTVSSSITMLWAKLQLTLNLQNRGTFSEITLPWLGLGISLRFGGKLMPKKLKKFIIIILFNGLHFFEGLPLLMQAWKFTWSAHMFQCWHNDSGAMFWGRVGKLLLMMVLRKG